MMLPGAVVPNRNIALFLDVDGTLLEIAATPDAVRVPSALRHTLQVMRLRENGALALISGRAIANIDNLFAPYLFAAAGQHGLERRDAHGKLTHAPVNQQLLNRARETLRQQVAQQPEWLMEDKGSSLALHYRHAEHTKLQAQQTMQAIVADMAGQYVLRAGKFVLEITPKGYTKRTAIEAFMREPPFAGRVPVFIGDDITDEDGFSAVNRLQGYSIKVGSQPQPSLARYEFASVAAVIAWLRQLAPRAPKF